MNKPDLSPAAQKPENTAQSAAAGKAAPGVKGSGKGVQYKVKLSQAEAKQLIELRDNCRLAGVRASKAKLLRAAVALLNEHSSFKIGEQLQELASSTNEQKKKHK